MKFSASRFSRHTLYELALVAIEWVFVGLNVRCELQNGEENKRLTAYVFCLVHTDFSVSCVLCTNTAVCRVFCAYRLQFFLRSVHTDCSMWCVLSTQT